MTDFPMEEQRNGQPVPETVTVAETPAETSVEVSAEVSAEQPAAPVQEAAAENAADTAAVFEQTAAPEEASWSSEQPVEPVAPAGPAYAQPKPAKAAKQKERTARRNPGRMWGVCIGLALGILCCGCLVLLTFFAVNAGRGLQPPVGSAQPGDQTQQPVEPDAPDAAIEIHEVPREEDGFTTQYIAEQVKDSVVGILVYDGFSIEPAGGGTGIIMSEDGYIITNAHVVVDSQNLTVVMHDETRHSARVVGYDEKTDLAVIKINATGLQPAEFGDSDAVVVGERVIAIGNPGGLAGSVSQGIVSGLDREISITLSDNTMTTITAIQTDAAINPGNSGGPLLNAWGQVIGINSSKIVASGYEGIGFSIPVNDAKPIIDNLIQFGYVKDRAVLGITVIALDSTNGPANGLPSQGLYIASIEPYSDMLAHGIDPGDVILKANGVELISTDDLTEELKKFRPGDTITMEILHVYDNRTLTVDILLLDAKAAEG